MSASLRLPLMCPAPDRTAPLHRITWALGIIIAAATTAAAAIVTGDHVVPEEVILTADTAGVAPGGGPVPTTHHDHDHLNNNAIGHDPAEGINPATGVGLDPWEDAPVINPILQIANVTGVL